MKSDELRARFIKYFEGHGHQHVSSSRLIPENDPTLLFINAGMNQFKNVFLGHEKRDYVRAVSSQKCVRAGGKHNDLDNVGHTARHHTFFEMLGNFSFGDYFKKDAIHYAWDFITQELGLPKDRLYVSVFTDDDEAAEIWHKQEGVPKDRISRYGEKDNFWRMGDTGPCGPCSEIFYDFQPEKGGNPMDEQGDRCIEIWNLVFMQFNEAADGSKTPLPKPSVDTGMGLERLAAVMQGKFSNYHTDLFQDIFSRLGKSCGLSYEENCKDKKQQEINVAMSVLADHARASAFLIGDGVLPSNEGRGYVLRRIMRRAIRYGNSLTSETGLLPDAVNQVIENMQATYPELKQQQKLIETTVLDEESRFIHCLEQGTCILTEELNKLKKSGSQILDGKTAFKLYDTYGFPVDLTRIMSQEKGFDVDEAAFTRHMEEARQVAKASWKGKGISTDQAQLIQVSQEIKQKHGVTDFLGFHGVTHCEGKVLFFSDQFMVLDKTCFYAESGGQVGDMGTITGPKGVAEVVDCTKHNDIHLLHIALKEGSFSEGETVQQQVSDLLRRGTTANHSATHLMHAALRKVLGEHVTQAGSLVAPDRLRFDFTHNKPISPQEIQQIENLVNEEVAQQNPVDTQVMTPKEATNAGALALFGEKYGDQVRVVQMGPFSMELCGGTHVENTAMIRIFKIVSEGGVSSGVRRIEAITGDTATRFLLKNTQENLLVRESTGLKENWSQYLNQAEHSVTAWVDKSREDIKVLSKELQKTRGQQVNLESLIDGAKSFSSEGKEGRLVFADIAMDDRKILSDISDKLRSKVKSGVVIVVGQGDQSHPIIVSVSKDLVGPLNAGQILKEVAASMGGKGGGRPDFAQGAAKDRSKIAQASAVAHSLVGLQ